MPNRMLRDWTNSDKINCLTVEAERFFTRLIMKVDDYGIFYADERILKANLFPLLIDEVSTPDLSKWINECVSLSLVIVYTVNDKRYLQINDFRQRLDKAKAKYPLPPVNEPIKPVNDFPAELNRSRTEVEVEVLPSQLPPAPPMTPDDYKSIDILKESCHYDKYFYEPICMKLLINKEILYQWLLNFNEFLRLEGTEQKTHKDYRKHFTNWISKQTDIKCPDKWELIKAFKQPEQSTYNAAEQYKALLSKTKAEA